MQDCTGILLSMQGVCVCNICEALLFFLGTLSVWILSVAYGFAS